MVWEGMDVVLQQHDAKHIYKVPEGLRELCSDISREVLRSQPAKVYQFIADYVNALLITRENTKVAVQVVGNILSGSEAIVNILFQTRLTLEQIVAVAPRVQKAFREYLDSIDQQDGDVCEGYTCDEKSKMLLKEILEATGATEKQAHRAATVIQAAFRGHYQRMKVNEAKGLIMWQRAVGNTLNILKKAGVPQREIAKAAPLIQFAYRGYYTRRNIKIKEACQPDEELKVDDVIEPRDNLQAVAWLNMLFEESGLTIERANEAAYIIQLLNGSFSILIGLGTLLTIIFGYALRMRSEGHPAAAKAIEYAKDILAQNTESVRAYRRYRLRKQFQEPQRVESTRSMVVEAIIEQLHQKVFQTVLSRDDVPTEYGTREEMKSTGMKLEIMYKEHKRQSRLSAEGAAAKAEVPKEVPADEELPSEVKEAKEKEKDTVADDHEEPGTEDHVGPAADVKQEFSYVGDKVELEIEQSPDEEEQELKEKHHEREIILDEDHDDDKSEEEDAGEEEEEEEKKESLKPAEGQARKESIEKQTEETKRVSQEKPVGGTGRASQEKSVAETRKASQEKPVEEASRASREKSVEETRKASQEKSVAETRRASQEKSVAETRRASQEKPLEETRKESHEKPATETEAESHEKPAEETEAESHEKPAEETEAESHEKPAEEAATEGHEKHAEEDRKESQEKAAEEGQKETQEEPAAE